MAALGAAYLAGLGVGFWESLEDLDRHWKIDRIYEPKMPEDKRKELYAGWKEAVKRSLGWAK
jgi:glycerol kinase